MDKRDKGILVRVSLPEREQLLTDARNAGLTLNSHARQLLGLPQSNRQPPKRQRRTSTSSKVPTIQHLSLSNGFLRPMPRCELDSQLLKQAAKLLHPGHHRLDDEHELVVDVLEFGVIFCVLEEGRTVLRAGCAVDESAVSDVLDSLQSVAIADPPTLPWVATLVVGRPKKYAWIDTFPICVAYAWLDKMTIASRS